MVAGMPFRDNDYEKLHPEEFPDPDTEEVGDEVVRCPHCGQWVFEEADQCPACGNYLTFHDRARGKPIWVIAVALFLLIWIILYWI